MEEQKCIRITKYDIKVVKNLMDLNRITYVQAEGESDVICVRYVQKRMAYACLSEDMDMFVYGCNRVIRDLDIINQRVTIYYFQSILSDLRLSYYEFRDVCVLVSNDYRSSKINIYKAMGLLRKWRYLKKNGKIVTRFYRWLYETKKIDSIREIIDVVNLFNLNI